MVDIKLQIDESFFNEEERSGYTVTKEMKEVWAVELDLLNEFMNFCTANNLRWFTDGGTSLGVARHQGFVPWDDDIDIIMPREDYDRFLQIADFEEPYFLQTPQSDNGFVGYHCRLQRPDTTAISINSHNKKHTFKQGIFIDIFPFDKATNVITLRGDLKPVNYFKNLANVLRDDAYMNGKELPTSEILSLLSQGKEIMTSHSDSTSGLLYSYSVSGSMHNIRFANNYEQSVDAQFEMLTVKVPTDIETTLAIQYGNWRKYKKGSAYHKMWLFDASHPYTDYLNFDEVVDTTNEEDKDNAE